MSKRKSPQARQQPAAETQTDLAAELQKLPGLSTFSFDGPWPVSSSYDLLDSMYCADNGRYYDTPISWYGLARITSSARSLYLLLIFSDSPTDSP